MSVLVGVVMPHGGQIGMWRRTWFASWCVPMHIQSPQRGQVTGILSPWR